MRNTYDKERTILEIGFAPLAPQLAKDWHTIFRKLLTRYENAVEKNGAAPKSRFEICLKDFDIWK